MTLCRAVLVVAALVPASLSCNALQKQMKWERQGQFGMVDVTGKSKDDAEATIRSYGITGSVSVVDNYTCDDPKVKEGYVCYTAPRAGNTTSTRIPVTLYLRPKETPWYVMPDVRGKTAEEAKRILIGLGQQPERFIVEDMRGWLDECEPSRVCRQSPEPGAKTFVTLSKWLEIAPATRPARPTPPPPPREPDPEDRPPEPPADKPPADKPPEPPPPEPIF